MISTHSPLLLEAAWAIRMLQANQGAPGALFELFDLYNSPGMRDVFNAVLAEKAVNSFYFEPGEKGVTTRDISSLDPCSEDDSIAIWGGITQLAAEHLT